jgi:hypothetical protein
MAKHEEPFPAEPIIFGGKSSPPMLSKDWLCAWRSSSSGTDWFERRVTRRCGSGYGNGRNSTPFTTLKMAVFAPIPKARVITATRVKPGFLPNERSANFRSEIIGSSAPLAAWFADTGSGIFIHNEARPSDRLS